MNWQPIETAPTDMAVCYGYWQKDYSSESAIWREYIGVVWRRHLFFFRVLNTDCSFVRNATHWKPAPRVPDAMPKYGEFNDYYRDGWNDCRAAMLAAAPEAPKP